MNKERGSLSSEDSGSTELVRAFKEACDRRDYRAARKVFNGHSLTIWYGVPVDELGRMLDSIVSAQPDVQDIATGFQVFLASSKEQRFFAPRVVRTMQETSSAAGLMLRFGYFLDLRLRGHANEALALFDVLREDLLRVHPFTDPLDGWPQFLQLQQGIAAMLAGQFSRALRHFTETLALPVAPGFELIHRNALVRSALIEGSFGSQQSARLLYAKAALVPRSDSWAEASLDASAELVGVLIEEDNQVAGRKLAVLDLAELGEMWPFYVFADYIVHDRAGAHARIPTRFSNLGSLPFPRAAGEGFSGSVLPLLEAGHKLYAGAIQETRDLIKQADPGFFLAKFTLATLALSTGDPATAVRLTEETRAATVKLRSAELWRSSMSAQAHLALGDEQAAIRELRPLGDFTPPLIPSEVDNFTREVSAVAGHAFAWWPNQPVASGAYFERMPERQELLTDREQQVLELVAQGFTRPQIAETLFISLNTLKSQLRSVYRKLGASSRSDAIQKASHRGLL